jgi:HSP20 family molecular chaperone IbpA
MHCEGVVHGGAYDTYKTKPVTFGPGLERALGNRGAIAATDWAPAVDILETDKELIIKMELPGVDAKAISVNVDSNVLTIKGERHVERDLRRKPTIEWNARTAGS